MSKVRCTRFEEPVVVSEKSWTKYITYAVGGVACFTIFWFYNHITGGCNNPADLLTYCEYHPPTISPTIIK